MTKTKRMLRECQKELRNVKHGLIDVEGELRWVNIREKVDRLNIEAIRDFLNIEIQHRPAEPERHVARKKIKREVKK